MLTPNFRVLNSARWWRYLPILAVALLEIGVFSKSCVNWWNCKRQEERPTTFVGEGMVVRGDGLGYYAWLRSMLIDQDWSFDNEFDEHNIFGDGLPPPKQRTRLGLRMNFHPIGPACVWAPAVVTTHVLLSHWPGSAPWPTDGYSLPYQLAVGCTSLCMSLLGLGFLFGICRLFTGPGWAASAAALLALGTTIVYYEALEVSMAHGMGTTALAVLVWYWLKTYGSLGPRRWLLLGVFLGVAVLMRWQLAIFAILPAGECLLVGWRALRAGSMRELGRMSLGLGLAGLAAFVVFTPQMIAWHGVFGYWLGTPHHLAHRWRSPSLGQVLISQDRSLFYWTPITLIAFSGLLIYCLKRPVSRDLDEPGDAIACRRRPIALLAIAFAVQIYFLAAVYGTGVYLGAAYGFRLLTESLVVLVPGLALLLSRPPRIRARLICSICCVLVAWNLLLIREYRCGLLPSEDGASLASIAASAPEAIRRFELMPGRNYLSYLIPK